LHSQEHVPISEGGGHTPGLSANGESVDGFGGIVVAGRGWLTMARLQWSLSLQQIDKVWNPSLPDAGINKHNCGLVSSTA